MQVLQTIKNFFAKKSLGFYFTVATLACTLLGVIFFGVLKGVSFETSENPVLVIVLAVFVLVCCMVAGFKDYFKAPSLVTFILSAATLCAFIAGRVSYFAFYVSGDVMGTGLSPFFVLTTIFFSLATITSVVAMCLKQEQKQIVLQNQ